MVDLDIRVSVLYECKVAESGYELVTKPATSKITRPKKLLMPKIKATRYITKPFKWDAVAEFIELFPFQNSEEIDDQKRLLFCNNLLTYKSFALNKLRSSNCSRRELTAPLYLFSFSF